MMTGDNFIQVPTLADASVDVVVTSPPYWGQREGPGIGQEPDPREYLRSVARVFEVLRPKMKHRGILWVNLGDAYNTPVNWSPQSAHKYSTLGPQRAGLPAGNAAYVKPRGTRRAFVKPEVPWLRYGSLLALPHRLVAALCDLGYLLRGEVIWRKRNPLPEGRCRRPHRQHEVILLLALREDHEFRVSPPVGSVWEVANELPRGERHYSRFPVEIPRRCIEAYGLVGGEVLVLDPFSGSGTTGIAARSLGCSFVGVEIDPLRAEESRRTLGITGV